MKHLLAVNTYDKLDHVEAWSRQFAKLDQSKWQLEVVCNGPNAKDGWIKAANPDATGGYKHSLAATRPGPDIDVVVSVHAKTALSNIHALDNIVDTLLRLNCDALFTPREPYAWTIKGADGQPAIAFGPPYGEYLFLFAVKADKWNSMVDLFVSDVSKANMGTEVWLSQCINALGMNVKRIPSLGPNIFCILGERAQYGVFGGMVNVYGCEKTASDRHSSEYWKRFGLETSLDEVRRKEVDEWFSVLKDNTP